MIYEYHEKTRLPPPFSLLSRIPLVLAHLVQRTCFDRMQQSWIGYLFKKCFKREIARALRRQIVSKMSYLDMRRMLGDRHHLTQDDVDGFSRLLRKYEQSHAEFVERRRKEEKEKVAGSDKIPLAVFIEYVNSLPKLDVEDKGHVLAHLHEYHREFQSLLEDKITRRNKD